MTPTYQTTNSETYFAHGRTKQYESRQSENLNKTQIIEIARLPTDKKSVQNRLYELNKKSRSLQDLFSATVKSTMGTWRKVDNVEPLLNYQRSASTVVEKKKP